MRATVANEGGGVFMGYYLLLLLATFFVYVIQAACLIIGFVLLQCALICPPPLKIGRGGHKCGNCNSMGFANWHISCIKNYNF